MPDTEKLQGFLKFIQDRTHADQIEVLEFKPLSGGAVQENHGLSVRMTGGSMPGDHRFVIRSDAPVALSVSLGRAEEFEILRMACAAGVKAPRAFWCSSGKDILEQDFYIMDWAPGTASARTLTKDHSLSREQRRGLMFELGRNLALLHQIQYETDADALPFLAPPAGSPAQHRLQQCIRLLDQLGTPCPAIELGIQYLAQHCPDTREVVLCHCDFRTGNYLVDDGALTAILDWEFASWSDPYEDLGWMCARCWRFGHPERQAGGVGDKADLFAGYGSVSGNRIDPVRLAYWELMANARWAVLALEQSHRHLSGQQPSLELALTGRMLPEIQQDLLRHLRELMAMVGAGGAPTAPATGGKLPARPGRSSDQRRDSPDALVLLEAAHSELMEKLLPVLPGEQRYNAHMIANAIGMAIREHTLGNAVRDAQRQLLQSFYAIHASNRDGHALSDLARDIRDGHFTVEQQPSLLSLMDSLMNLELSISNPKRLQSGKTT
ncbi:phosphotransferase [Castellaniella sp. WN]